MSDAVAREPQPGDGPDYHADHQAWERRQREDDKFIILRASAEVAEDIARLIAAMLSLNGFEHNEPCVVDVPPNPDVK